MGTTFVEKNSFITLHTHPLSPMLLSSTAALLCSPNLGTGRCSGVFLHLRGSWFCAREILSGPTFAKPALCCARCRARAMFPSTISDLFISATALDRACKRRSLLLSLCHIGGIISAYMDGAYMDGTMSAREYEARSLKLVTLPTDS